MQRLQRAPAQKVAWPTGIQVTGPQTLQLPHQGEDIGILQHPCFLVKADADKTGFVQHGLQGIGGDELVDMRMAVNLGPGLTQFTQGSRAKAGEEQSPARTQNPMEFLKSRSRTGRPLQGHIGEHQIHGTTGDRQAFGIADHPPPRKTLRRLP